MRETIRGTVRVWDGTAAPALQGRDQSLGNNEEEAREVHRTPEATVAGEWVMQARMVEEVVEGRGPGRGADRGRDSGATVMVAAAAAVAFQTGLHSTTVEARRGGSLGDAATLYPGRRHQWDLPENSEAAGGEIATVLGMAPRFLCRRTNGFAPNSRNRGRLTEEEVEAGPLVVLTSERWRG